LKKFKGKAKIYITHLKPGEMELIMDEVNHGEHGFQAKMLLNNQVFEL
jgi:hypothetical protein